jgi:hypothetical protein
MEIISFLTDAKEGLLTGISGIWQKQYMNVCVSEAEPEEFSQYNHCTLDY